MLPFGRPFMAGPVRLAYRSREAGEGGLMIAHALAHHAPAAGGCFVAERVEPSVAIAVA